MLFRSASSLALMDAGVPIKRPVAGISSGLIVNEENDQDYLVFMDIQGIEDFFGDMDFKVAGTTEGITSIQVDLDRVAFLDHILNPLHATPGHFRNVDQAFFAWQEFNKSTKVHQSCDDAVKNLTRFRVIGNAADDRQRFFSGGRIGRCDKDTSVVLNVDFDTCLGNDEIGRAHV